MYQVIELRVPTSKSSNCNSWYTRYGCADPEDEEQEVIGEFVHRSEAERECEKLNRYRGG